MGLIKKGPTIRSEEEKSWEDLVDQIWAGNVIPVIGDNLVVNDTTIIKEIIDYLARVKGLEHTPQSFSELYYDKGFAEYQPVVYEEVSSLIEENQPDFEPTDILKDFLSIEQFPFVITTSVDYTVEETMRDIWEKERGRKLRTLVFRNDTTTNDDIKRDSDIKEPTVYYMFGKADNRREHSFVLTEEDLLSFCQSWLSSDKHPSLLSKVLGNKYLLFFGVNYPDWLIRFIWFSMRNNLRDSGMLVDNRELESSLLNFFQRVSIRTQLTPFDVMKKIKSRLEIKKKEYELSKFDSVPKNMDFFISYSRRDLTWANTLYQALTDMGYKVWFDKKNITVTSDWAPKISEGIHTAKHVIILLSENVALESEQYHVYREEWEIALSNRLCNKKHVIPVCLENTNLYNDERLKLSNELKRIQALFWENKNSLDDIIENLVSIIN